MVCLNIILIVNIFLIKTIPVNRDGSNTFHSVLDTKIQLYKYVFQKRHLNSRSTEIRNISIPLTEGIKLFKVQLQRQAWIQLYSLPSDLFPHFKSTLKGLDILVYAGLIWKTNILTSVIILMHYVLIIK